VGNDFGHRMREGQGPWRGGAKGLRAKMAMMEMLRRQEAQFAALDLTKITFPVMAVNGEFDRPRMRTHRFWRELSNFTSVVLPGKGHLTAMMAGYIPDLYIDAYAAFIVGNNPRP
jgi:pimeloyl-ACP methyl ester carboxylesterase